MQSTNAQKSSLDLGCNSYGIPYQAIIDAKKMVKSQGECWFPPIVAETLKMFAHSARAQETCLSKYISNELYCDAYREFVLLLEALPVKQRFPFSGKDKEALEKFIISSFIKYVEDNYRFSIEEYKNRVHSKDLSKPHLWFPVARAMQRKIIYHAGPTNSGKTYNALEAMKRANSGVYCGPLRLLAMEVYEACNLQGTHCSLVTGQERREVPGATHLSCTVEMINLNKRVDIAVLDEIQVIGDDSRGWAWTRALLGVPASEIHVCGDGSAVDLVRWIAEQVGDPFEIREYDRFTPLEVEEDSLKKGYSSVRPGDCVVAFSRHDIFSIKALIESKTPYKACVVYGALPPETRRQQAKLFNDPNSGYDIMVASDAVGMGLNLNIRRVIFHKMEKREGSTKALKPVSVSMVKQIAGRAGRRSSQYSEGKATCLDKDDVRHLRRSLNVPLEKLATPKAGLYPEFEHFEAFAAGQYITTFSELVQKFAEKALLHNNYFFCRQEGTVDMAKMLERIPGLSMEDLYSFCMAPASTTDLRIAAAMLHFAKKYASRETCELEINPGTIPPSTVDAMRDFEAAHQVVTLWLWLAHRFGDDYFPSREKASMISHQICSLLAQGLENITNSDSMKQSSKGTKLTRTESSKGRRGKKGNESKVCKNSKQLFMPYKQEFFVLLAEARAKQEADTQRQDE